MLLLEEAGARTSGCSTWRRASGVSSLTLPRKTTIRSLMRDGKQIISIGFATTPISC